MLFSNAGAKVGKLNNLKTMTPFELIYFRAYVKQHM
jgi:hypothetical protein